MQDTVNVGDVVSIESTFYRWTTADPIRKVPADAASGSVIITKPDATTTTVAVGAMRHPDTGRYATDQTVNQQGIWLIDWNVTLTFTDEDGNSRSATVVKHDELIVAPA